MQFKREYAVLVQGRWQDRVLANNAEHAVCVTYRNLGNTVYWHEPSRKHLPYFDLSCGFVMVQVCCTRETIKVAINYDNKDHTFTPTVVWE